MVTLYMHKKLIHTHLDFYKVIVNMAKYRIDNNKNYLFNVAGQTGSGKSLSALFLAEEIQKATLPSIPFDIRQVVFSGVDFMRLILGDNPLPKGSVIIWDEIGVGMNAKKAMTALNIALNNVFQIFRSRNYIFISTTPDHNFIDKSTRKLLHMFMEAKKIDYKEGTNQLLVNITQFNTKLNKIYFHNIKYKEDGQETIVLPFIYTKLPSDLLLKNYNKKKEAFNARIYKHTMGMLKTLENLSPLTDKQQQVYELNDKGFNAEDISKSIGKTKELVYVTLRAIEKKGYNVKRAYQRTL